MTRRSEVGPAGWLSRELERLLRARNPLRSDADLLTAYPEDPVGFARDVLGVELWGRQAEWVAAVGRGNMRVSVASGRRTGKSTGCAVLAIWCFCTFDRARVVLIAPTAKQIGEIVWGEVRRLVRGAKVAIPGGREIGVLAHTGMTHPSSGATLKGFVARDAEGMQGLAAPTSMFLIDEASGVGSHVFEATQGNRAGGHAWEVLTGNPTKADGRFYDSHHSMARSEGNPSGYLPFVISSYESPNVVAGRVVVPGLATREWIAEVERDYGTDSWFVNVHVRGRFVAAEEGRVIGYELIGEAEARWDETAPSGRLWIGCDPAGPGREGDEASFTARRGRKMWEPVLRRGLSPDSHVAVALDIRTQHPEAREAVIVLDAEGETGNRVRLAFLAYLDTHPNAFELMCVRSSQQPQGLASRVYERVEDQLYAEMRSWLADGGALPSHAKLRADLHAPEWLPASKGRIKITPKADRRKILGRSPDAGDSATLACHEPLALRMNDANVPAAARPASSEEGGIYDQVGEVSASFDPYGQESGWSGSE